jgi:hypothetical protein
MQHRTQVTQAGGRLPLERVRVDAGGLRRHVGAHPQHAPVQLVGQLEGLQVEVMSGAGQQGLQVFDEGRHDQFVAPARVQIEQFPPRALQPPGMGRQDFLDAFRQQPLVASAHRVFPRVVIDGLHTA